MKTSTFIWIILGALVLGLGVAALVYFGNGAQTQVVSVGECGVQVGDRDGDCISDEFDYYPDDPSR
jgi:hypothetical protein